MENIFVAKREIAYDSGNQYILIVNGIVESVKNVSRFANNQLIGYGVDQLEGKMYKELRGMGFRKTKEDPYQVFPEEFEAEEL